MSEYTWTQTGRRWTLDAAPRYAVESRAAGRYALLIDGYEVDTADTLPAARTRLAGTYEYEEHGAELEQARRRLRQAEERLAERYPRAARDPQLVSILSGLRDALGAGPEAGEGTPEREPDVWRCELAPDLAVAIDASLCIVFEVTDGTAGRVLRRPTVSRVEAYQTALDTAREVQHVKMDEADLRRLAGPDDRRRAEGRLTRREAVEWLMQQGWPRGRAVSTAAKLRDEGGSVNGMIYADGYWHVPVTQAAGGDAGHSRTGCSVIAVHPGPGA